MEELVGFAAQFLQVMIIPATIAVVNRIKDEAPVLPPYWYTIMAFGVAAIFYVVSVYAPEWVGAILIYGLGASGIFDIREGKTNIIEPK
jgi:hypothetical protein